MTLKRNQSVGTPWPKEHIFQKSQVSSGFYFDHTINVCIRQLSCNLGLGSAVRHLIKDSGDENLRFFSTVPKTILRHGSKFCAFSRYVGGDDLLSRIRLYQKDGSTCWCLVCIHVIIPLRQSISTGVIECQDPRYEMPRPLPPPPTTDRAANTMGEVSGNRVS